MYDGIKVTKLPQMLNVHYSVAHISGEENVKMISYEFFCYWLQELYKYEWLRWEWENEWNKDVKKAVLSRINQIYCWRYFSKTHEHYNYLQLPHFNIIEIKWKLYTKDN